MYIEKRINQILMALSLVATCLMLPSPSIGEIGSITIENATTTLDQEFMLNVKSRNDELHRFVLSVSFDPQMLEAIEITEGNFLNNDGADETTCTPANIDNSTGKIDGFSCTRQPLAGGVTGRGVIAQITFKAIQAGETMVEIEDAVLADELGENLLKEEGLPGKITIYGLHGEIKGIVLGIDGLPVQGATVEALTSEGISVGIGGRSDRTGSYLIDNITEPGNYDVRITKPNFVFQIKSNVLVEIESSTRLDFSLYQPTALHSVVDSQGFIRDWLLLGPIPWEEDGTRLNVDQLLATGTERVPKFEEPIKRLTPHDGDFGTGLAKNLRWKLHNDDDRDIALDEIYKFHKGFVAYAFTRVKSSREQTVSLLVGSSDGVAVWINDELIRFNAVERDRGPDQDTVDNVKLNAGWNNMLIKVANREYNWGFLARFASQVNLLADLEPIIDLEISPQWPLPEEGLTQGIFNRALVKGLNLISLPLQPDTPFTAQTLLDKLDATVLTKLDEQRQTFVPYLPGISKDFSIEGGAGYIVNVTDAKTVTFTGTVWNNVNAAPNFSPGGESTVWAFVIGGKLRSDDPAGGRKNLAHFSRSEKITVRNLRTGQVVVGEIRRSAQDDQGRYAVAIADLSRQSVVEVGDRLEIRIDGIDASIRYVVTDGDLRRAFARIDIDPSALLPKQTILLQNYPNPFNPETWMPYQLIDATEVGITIYDIRGMVVRRLDLGHKPSGYYHNRGRAAYWDGRSTSGESVSSGIYFYQLTAGEFTSTRRMVIVK